MNPNPIQFSILLIFLQIQFFLTNSYPTAMNCTDTKRVCTSFIAFQPDPSQNQTSSVLQSMFDVLQNDITIEKNYVFIKKNCSCSSQVKKYLTNTTYTVRSDDDGVLTHDVVIDAYDGLAYIAKSSRKTRVGAVVSLQLFCGCSSGPWNYLISYVLKDGDSVESLASRFGVSMDSIETVNGFSNPDNVTVGELYYIPLNSVPGEPYPIETDLPPAPVPSPPADIFSENRRDRKAKVPYAWILGSVGIGLGLILVTVLACILLRSPCCCAESQGGSVKGPDGKNHHNFHILRPTTFFCGSGRYICCKPGDWRLTNGEPTDRHINIPKAIGADVFDMEKPVIFQYDEVLFSTDRFADSNLLGNGTYGSVYYGLLRDQEVAIKRMNAMKTKEFLAEMKVLCKVHHSNLVELIGYAATDDELFLIYEYSQKGSLHSHLHDPQNKGQTTLSWIMRVQIALDAARGLEYIHEHTKTHYVHRDIKSSNILLDGAFRGKISDFGLAKLIGKTNEGEEASVTRVVGTFGYLAPEYLSDGLATTKSDVYAFGVVLFEMISGREAITRTEGMATKNSERRSLASIMLAALKNSPDCTTMASMKDYIDPNLMKLYPHDCLFKSTKAKPASNGFIVI